MAHKIIADFWSDYVETLKQHLASQGFITTGSEKDKDFFIAYFNWLHRRISPKPRTVHISTNFRAPTDFTNEVDAIIEDIEAGTDITPRLSRFIIDWTYNDSMLSDWGIYHLHLGRSLDPDGFIARTGSLLFARFDDANAYIFGVFDHKSWTNQEIVEIAHANWPSTIAQYKLNVEQIYTPATSGDRKTLRAARINALVQLKDGSVYSPIGGGMALDGTPIVISSKLIDARRSCRQQQKHAENELLKYVGQGGPEKSFTMRLELSGPNGFAVEDTTGFRLKLW